MAGTYPQIPSTSSRIGVLSCALVVQSGRSYNFCHMIRVSILPIVVYAILSVALPAYSAVSPFTATHTYVLGDNDSRNAARQKCLAEAKRKILEQVGVYLESHSE